MILIQHYLRAINIQCKSLLANHIVRCIYLWMKYKEKKKKRLFEIWKWTLLYIVQNKIYAMNLSFISLRFFFKPGKLIFSGLVLFYSTLIRKRFIVLYTFKVVFALYYDFVLNVIWITWTFYTTLCFKLPNENKLCRIKNSLHPGVMRRKWNGEYFFPFVPPSSSKIPLINSDYVAEHLVRKSINYRTPCFHNRLQSCCPFTFHKLFRPWLSKELYLIL